MEKLGARNCYMISDAFKTNGRNFDWAYTYIEENLYIDEASEVREFMEWICDNDVPCTENSMEERFREFKEKNK